MKRRRVGSLLALAVLAVVRERPVHPYEMASVLRARGKDQDMPIKWGSLYTVVGNLEKHGLIEVAGSERSGARPERTVYRITAAGREELADWVRELIGTPEREQPRFEAGLSVLGVLQAAQAVRAAVPSGQGARRAGRDGPGGAAAVPGRGRVRPGDPHRRADLAGRPARRAGRRHAARDRPVAVLARHRPGTDRARRARRPGEEPVTEVDTAAVTSADGTTIGYRSFGAGPPLLVLHGAMQSGLSQRDLAEALADRFTVVLPDRRGRGASGTFGPDWSLDREVEDVAALVTGTGARLGFGISSGAVILLEAALTGAFERLALFE